MTFLRPTTGRKGFTLLEMVITMAIFLLLAGAVFGIINGVLQGAATLHDNQTRRDEIEALGDYLTDKLSSMTTQGVLMSYRRDGENQANLIVADSHKAWVLDAEVQPNGYYTLRLARFWGPDGAGIPSAGLAAIFKNAILSNDSSLKWVPLMRDIKSVSWRFQSVNNPNWVDDWTDASRPSLVELTYQPAGGEKPVTMDFWLPTLTPLSLRTVAPGQVIPPAQNAVPPANSIPVAPGLQPAAPTAQPAPGHGQ